MSGEVEEEGRRPRLLWASVYCLLDTSSGAAMAVRQMLRQLQLAGWEIQILGATIFDHERGTAGLGGHWPEVRRRRGEQMAVESEGMEHRLLVTAGTHRGDMTNREEGRWFNIYFQALSDFRPDVVFYYGGQPFDQLIADEARSRGIAVAFYLANGNYRRKDWCRDVDLVLTDSRATANLYRERLGIDVTPVGAFIDPARVVADRHGRERMLFVNPVAEKGAYWVACLALRLERRRPDIVFEVVESRGDWAKIVRSVTARAGEPRESLDNVVVTAHGDDMRPAYGRARAVLAPSLWWESSGRVLAEAMLNGIPAIATDRGGAGEMVQNGGIMVRLPEKFYRPPYTLLPDAAETDQIAGLIESLYDDQALYDRLVEGARQAAEGSHGLEGNSRRLEAALMGVIGDSPLPQAGGG